MTAKLNEKRVLPSAPLHRADSILARQNETELRDLIESLPAMVFIALPGPSNAFVSRGWREYTGLSAEDTDGIGWQSVVHPEDLERHVRKWRVCSETGEAYEDEARFRRTGDGAYRWFLVRAVPQRDEHGDILKWYGILTDIEDRKQAEQALQRSEIYWAEAQRLSRTGSFGWKPSTGEIIWSEETFRIFQYNQATKPTLELILQRVHPEDVVQVRRTIERAQDGKDFNLEHRLVMPDGSIKYVRVVAHATSDESGAVEFVGAVMDVTSAKETEQTLREREAYLAEAQKLTHTGSGAWSVPRFDALYLSDEWYRIYGFDPKQGLSAWKERIPRMHPDDRAKVEEIKNRAIRDKADYEVEHRIILPDGTLKYTHTVGHPVLNAAGDVERFVCTMMDVTERRQGEEAREALREAKADLARVSRVTNMGELTASLAHELNQPIAAAVTDATTLLIWLNRNEPDLEEARDAASRVVKDATRAAEIVNRIRQVFKKGTSQRELVDVNEVIREMTALLRGETTQYNILVATDLASDIPPIMGDRVQLQQVVMNLMLNGIEAMKDVDWTRELTIKSWRAKTDQIIVSVNDTGVGLAPEQREQIFDAFFTTKPHGLGMGLRISRSIIEIHGGRLWAADNPLRGASFHFTLSTKSEGQ